ncbi:MAG: hypothetical protein ABW090_06980 [Sedimenticola sp.]
MAMDSDTLHLLVPGLLGPIQNLDALQPFPKLPLLERLLSRADTVAVAGEDYPSTLLPLWGVKTPQGHDMPTAALRRLGDGGEPDGRTWIEVSPVHLRPDRDRLLLFDVEMFDFLMQEALDLVSLFNDHFAEIGWQLEALSAHRWYLSVEEPPGVTTHELSQVSGRNMDLFLPEGEEALKWHSLLNEVQMLFSSAPVNEARERRGKLPINGAWFSGIGQVPETEAVPFGRVFTDEPLARGLAVAAGVPSVLPTDSAGEGTGGQAAQLAVYDRLQQSLFRSDPFEWSDQLSHLDQWLSPIVRELQGGTLQGLMIYPCNGRLLRVTRGNLRRFWRRPGFPDLS